MDRATVEREDYEDGGLKKEVSEFIRESGKQLIRTTTTTTYARGARGENGSRQMKVEEERIGPRGDQSRMNLVRRKTTEYDEKNEIWRETTEYFGDDVNENPKSKLQEEWSVDPATQKRYKRYIRHYRWGGSAWVLTLTIELDPNGNIINRIES